MSRRLIVLDVALLVLLGFGVMKLRASWLAFGPAHTVAAIRPAVEPLAALPVQVVKAAVPENWTEVPARNPFSFDRNDVDVLAPVEVAAPKPAAPKPLLFGIMFFDSQKVAMLGSGQPGNRAFRPLKVGESIDGWIVVSIEAKTAVVELNGAKETLIMNDPTAQIPRDVVRTAALPPAQPAPVTASPSATSAVPAVNPSAPNVPAQLPPGTKTRTVQTPFGTRTFIDPIP